MTIQIDFKRMINFLCNHFLHTKVRYLQSTPVISRQLGAKILERELSGSPVISRFRAKTQTRDLQDHNPTF